MPFDLASKSRRLCLLIHVLCTVLPDVDASSEESRCAQGCWWGPNAIGGDNLVIAARYEEDVSWMATHLQGVIPFIVYNTKDSTATHYTDVHKGNEAAAYLQFIVDYYDCLPQVMAFIHAHRRDMKVAPDFDMDHDLGHISWSSTPAFMSLNRSKLLWHIILTQHRRRHQQAHKSQEQTDYHMQAARAITVAWEQLLGPELGALPDDLHINGGGQFLVQQHRVLLHPRLFYQKCLDWLDNSTELSPWDKGMVFEYTWKSIFGEEAGVVDRNAWS